MYLYYCSVKSVRMKGLEPLPLAEPDPKSGASTNSATPAGEDEKGAAFLGSPVATGGVWDSNPRPTEPQSGTLTN